MNIESRPSHGPLPAACGLALLFLFLQAPTLHASPPRVFLLNAKRLAENRAKVLAGDKQLAPALNKLKRDADAALTAGPFSVMHKKLNPPSGDKHDYMTLATYWWPDPSKPDGLPYIRRDGYTSPELKRSSDRAEMNAMAENTQSLALAYYFTGDEKYSLHAATLLRAWFIDPATRMNPHLRYGQAILGRNTGRGFGLIETQKLTDVVDAVGLLAGSKHWTADDDRALRAWFKDFLEWMQTSKEGRDEAEAKNNHGTYYDVQVATFALYLDNPELARTTLEAARMKRLAVQIEPDGRQPLELTRTKAWGYSVANLRGLMKLATLGEHVGLEMWFFQTPDERGSIRQAVEFLVPFSLDGKEWTYQQLHGVEPEALHPLLRQAAVKYPDAPFIAKFKGVSRDPSSRDALLEP